MSSPPRSACAMRSSATESARDRIAGSALSSSSAQTLYQTLARFGRVPPLTVQALGEARASLVSLATLSRSKPLFPGRWDIGKMAAAVSRSAASDDCAAPSTSPDTAVVEARWALLAAALAVCPLSACARLSAAMATVSCCHTPLQRWLDGAPLSALAQQLSLEVGVEAPVAAEVVLSLLHDVHKLAVRLCVSSSCARSADNAKRMVHWQSFESLTSQMGAMFMQVPAAPARCALRPVSTAAHNRLSLPTSTAPPRKPPSSGSTLTDVLERYAGQWLAAVIDCAAYAPGLCLEPVLSYLCAPLTSCSTRTDDESTSSVAVVLHCLRLGWHRDVCVAAWSRLRASVLSHAYAPVTAHLAVLEQAWTQFSVTRHLRALLAAAPRHLADNYLAPLGGGLQGDSIAAVATLRALTEAATELPTLNVEAIARPLRALRCAGDRLSAIPHATPVKTVTSLTVDEYRAVVRPAAVLAWREGHVEEARDLLDWATPLHLDEGWRQRIRLRASSLGSPATASGEVGYESTAPSHSTPPDDTLPAATCLFPSYAARWAAQCSGTAVLDALIGESCAMPLGSLRCLCHALLHQVGPWAAAVLQDPFAYNVPFIALSQLVHRLLNVGDLPLARTYLSALCACVAQRRSRLGLILYLQAVARFAETATRAPLYSHRPALSAAHAAWVPVASQLRAFLSPHAGVEPRQWDTLSGSGVPRHDYAGGGAAFTARARVFSLLRGAQPPTSDSEAPMTVVTLRLSETARGDGVLVIKRQRLDDPLCARTPSADTSCVDTTALGLPAETRVALPIAARLREALVRVTAIMRENRLQLSTGCAASSRGVRQEWWRRRFQLEHALHLAIKDVDASLGYARAMLCGDLPSTLRVAVWALSTTLSAAVRKLLGEVDAPKSVQDLFSGDWDALLYVVMQALPILDPPLVPRGSEDEEEPGAQPAGDADTELRPPSYSLPFSPCCIGEAAGPSRTTRAEHDDSTLLNVQDLAVRVGCRGCEATRTRAVGVLTACLEERMTSESVGEGSEAHPCGAAFWPLIAVRVRDLCEQAVLQLLHRCVTWHSQEQQQCTADDAEAIHGTTAAAEDASCAGLHGSEGIRHDKCCSGDPGRGDGTGSAHVDVYRLPREHVHLVIEGSLHLMPWEYTDALRWFSVSRVPSVDYVVSARHLSDQRVTAHQLHRVHFAINEPCTDQTINADAPGSGEGEKGGRARSDSHSNGVTSRERFAGLFARYPHWTVSEDDVDLSGTNSTLRSSANTSKQNDSSASTDSTESQLPSPPPRRIASSATAALSRAGAASQLWGQLLEERVTGYVYVGHKTGEHLISRGELLDRCPLPSGLIPPRAPPLVCLMGCSSAFLAGGETYEGYGMPWAYLHAGTASLVGSLWDITDRDADRLTRRLLSDLAGERHPARSTTTREGVPNGRSCRSVGEALAQARLVCRLPYLTGAAFVLYGVNTLMEPIEANT